MITFVLAIHTKSAMNGNFGNSRAAAMAQAATDRKHHEAARLGTLEAMRRSGAHPSDLVPARVLVTRCSAGHLDGHDNLREALKRVVDGIAEALGIDDGGPFVDWDYDQAKVSPGVHGVRVRIERREGRR
jgi:hypothetical protein